MAANVTVIGRTTKVHGRVTGEVDLEIQGFVEGEVVVGGDVTVDAHGLVGAAVHGRRLVVRGAVRGDLVGEEAVVLEQGARVVGDVRAPRVAIAEGALVRGYVQTSDEDGAPARASRGHGAARPVAAARGNALLPAANASPASSAARPVAKAAAPPRSDGAQAAAHGANNSGPRRPPPPVVPALRRAKGQIAKKKER